MRVSINQPAYFGGESYFYRMLVSDVHIVLDHVQFEKGSYVNRTQINTKTGGLWLTVPVITSGRAGQAIEDVMIDETGPWRRKHLASIIQAYGREPHFDEYSQEVRGALTVGGSLAALLDASSFEMLNDHKQIEYSSILDPVGTGSEMILGLCRTVNATEYISGPNGRDYLNLDAFKRAGIKVLFQDYPKNVSAMEVLFREGPRAREVILSKGRLLDA